MNFSKDLQRVKVLLNLERYDDAEKILMNILKEDPKNIQARYKLGEFYINVKKLPKDKEQYYLQLFEDFPERYFINNQYIALHYNNNGQYKKH